MSSTPNWEQVKEIFSATLELEPDARDAFVAETCSDNQTLRSEVESWLASHAESEDFIETPAFSANQLFSNGTSSAGRQFGNYTIIHEIGQGGMGVVFLAERNDGEFEQQVALKVVRQSVAESHMIERFRSERQILASLSHPNIANLLDGGVSGAGEPFLVMEYIQGESITDHADKQGLDIDARLNLFQKVCSAVSYAHRNLVIHRDIKPSNILITADGEPKLLDFGLAKLIDENLPADPTNTQTTFRALTPAYASPEQLKGGAITTASDVYSLGVVLYELLTGDRPFHFTGKSLDEIIRTVTEFEPALPSHVDKTDPKLRGDLDNIVLTALRREPERRYLSIDQFADDISKYLRGLPVSARPNTLIYRSSKFIRRHRIGAAAGAMVLLSLIAGMAGTLWQSQQAQKQKEKAESINAFLEQTLKYSNPILSSLKRSGQETTVNEVLDEAARRLDVGEFDNEPEVKLELERTVAMTYFGQGKYQPARKHMAEHVALLRQVYGENDPKLMVGSAMWAGLLFAKGDMDEAESVYRQYLPLLRNEVRQGRVGADVLTDVINNFAYMRRTQGDSHEAELLFRETLSLMPQLSDEARKSVATTRSTLASTIGDQGRFDEALATARDAVDEYRQRGETDSPNYGFSLNVLGGFLTEKGELAEAETSVRDAETIFRTRMAPTSLWLGDNLRNEALLLYAQQKFPEAVAKANEAATIYENGFGKHYDHYPTVLIVKGLSLTRSGAAKTGETFLRDAVARRNATLSVEHFWVATANGALGECLTTQKRYEEAEDLLRKSYESLKTSQEPDSPRLGLARQRLVLLYEKWGKTDLAAKYRL